MSKLEEAAKAMYELWRTGYTGDLTFDPSLDWDQSPVAHDYWMAMAGTAFSKFEES